MPVDKLRPTVPENTLRTTHIVVKYSSIEECELYLKHPCKKISELKSRWTKDINESFCFCTVDLAFDACDEYGGTGVKRIQI